jgi:hypothetical protein
MRSIVRLWPALLTLACGLPFLVSHSVFGQCTPPPSGLVNWWPGDGDANDIHGSSDGTLQNGATFDLGEVGLAFALDGMDDFVRVETNPSFNFASSFTADAWINLRAYSPEFAPVVSTWNDITGSNRSYFLAVTASGQLRFSVSPTGGGYSDVFSSATVPLNTWTHVAGVFDASSQTMVVYINGEVEGVNNNGPSSVFQNNEPLLIGAGDLGSNVRDFTNGLIDEVELFNRALSDSEIQAIFNAGSAGKCKSQCVSAPANLVDWWPADGDALDYQGGNSGTLQNGATFAAGKVGQGFSLDGVDDSVGVGQTQPTNGEITLDAWVNPSTLSLGWPVGPVVFEKGSGIFNRVGMQIKSDGSLCVYVNTDVLNICSNPGVIPVNQFTHVALTVRDTGQGRELNAYANGQPVAQATGNDTLNVGTARFVIGDSEISGFYDNFAGIIDEVEMFDRALSQTEIQSIFNVGSAGKCKTSIASEGQFINISTRVSVGTDTNVGIAGFILRSDTSPALSKQVVVRGIGPSLTSRGVSGALQDPTIELRDANGALIASNDNWMDAANASALQATGLAPSDPKEAAILTTLSSSTTPGFTNYTAILAGKDNTTGVGLVEVYDLDSTSTTHLVNISTRAPVLTGDNVLIGGAIVRGGTAEEVVFRAIGPELGSRGVSNFLADPTLELHDGQGNLLDSNDNWMDSLEKDNIMASGLAPTDDRESAILATLFPGNYTAIVSGVGNTTGVGLVEAYRLGPPPLP